EVLEKFASRIVIHLPLNGIDKDFTACIGDLCDSCAGDKQVNLDLRVEDDLTKMGVGLTATRKLDVAAFCQQFRSRYPGFRIDVER
ncbi:MAG: hypothetical protein J6T56_02270, partial [Bacteroidales bacterium]|nr:hypothetical protein [Bacteroidales bacterium]